jgi:hypothetical protein
MDMLVHEQSGLDNNEIYWTEFYLDMDIKPDLNSNIKIKWTKYGKSWTKYELQLLVNGL